MADSKLRCSVCGREDEVDFAHGLRHGWPKCCGYTMTLERTEADVEKATGKVIREQVPHDP